jgi:hypothetical protein
MHSAMASWRPPLADILSMKPSAKFSGRTAIGPVLRRLAVTSAAFFSVWVGGLRPGALIAS